MPAKAFDKIMDRMTEAESLDGARRAVEVGKLSNQLKSDFTHQYIAADDARPAAAVDLVAERHASGASE